MSLKITRNGTIGLIIHDWPDY